MKKYFIRPLQGKTNPFYVVAQDADTALIKAFNKLRHTNFYIEESNYATCLYIYSDGHAVVMMEKQDEYVGLLHFVEIHEKYTNATCNFTGRIIFDRHNGGMWKLISEAVSISASEAKFSGGSTRTRELGIAVGNLEICLENEHPLHWYELKNVISGPYIYQPFEEEKFDADLKEWSGYKVAKIIRKK